VGFSAQFGEGKGFREPYFPQSAQKSSKIIRKRLTKRGLRKILTQNSLILLKIARRNNGQTETEKDGG
jgi:hypothetical protein